MTDAFPTAACLMKRVKEQNRSAFRQVARAICFLLSLFAAIGMVRAGENVPNVIRIASEGARPPYNYLENNDLAGFEIELGRELCARMNVTCTFVTQDWDNLIPGLLDHHYDAIMAALNITDENREKLAFSTPYVRMPLAFLGRRDEPITGVSAEALTGKKIGVIANTAFEAYAEDHFPKAQIQNYASLEEAILDLGEKRVDLVLADKADLNDFRANRREAQNTVIIGDLPRDPAYFGEGIGIGLRKADTALKAKFDQALEEIRKDGTFRKIRERFFPYEIE